LVVVDAEVLGLVESSKNWLGEVLDIPDVGDCEII